MAQQEMD